MKFIYTLLMISILLFAVPSSFSAYYLMLYIGGYVRDSHGNNYYGAYVQLVSPSVCTLENGVPHTTTDYSGHFELNELWYICYTDNSVTFNLNVSDGSRYNVTRIVFSGGGEYHKYYDPITLDIDPPTISFIPSSHDWTNQNVNVEIDAKDQNNVKGIYYKVISSNENCPSTGYSYTSSSSKQITLSNSGRFKICAYGVDEFGNKGSPKSSGIYKVDKVKPSISINSLPDYINKNYVTVSWSGIDSLSGISYYEFKIDNSGWVVSGSTSHTFTSLSDGSHTVEVKVFDNAGNMNSDSITFVVDTIPPSIVFNPNYHGWTNNSVGVEISASDSNFKELSYALVNASQDCSTASYTTTDQNHVDKDIENTGIWKVCAKAEDKAGNVVEKVSGYYKIDKKKPYISIDEPDNNSYLNHSNVEVKWTGSDSDSGIKEYKVYLDGQYVITTNSNSYNFNLNDGEHKIKVVAYDVAGNANSSTIYLYVDTVKPDITIVQPQDGEFTNKNCVTFKWVANDVGSGIDHYAFILDGNPPLQLISENVTVCRLEEGQHIARVIAYDKSGNSNEDQVEFNVDLTPPVVGNAMANLPYYNGKYYSRSGLLVKTFATAHDNFGINKCYYKTKYGQSEATYNGTHCVYEYVEPFNSRGVTFWFLAIDKAGNTKDGGNATIVVDNVNPTVSISTKRYWNTTPVLIHYVMSDNVLITKYDVVVDSTTHSYPYNGQSGSGDYLINSVPNGNHNVEFIVYDLVNNTGRSNLSFCFDNQVPSLTLENPIISGTEVTFKWDTSDIGCSGINHSELYIDNSLVYSGIDTNYTMELKPGDHVWRVVAFDNAGNKIAKESNIHIDNNPPVVTLISPNGEYLNNEDVVLKFKAVDDISAEMTCKVYVNNTNVWSGVVSNDTEKDVSISRKDGNYSWSVNCSDDAGNVGYSSSWFVIDTIAPQISILEPSDGSYLNDNKIEIKFDVSDKNLDYTNVSVYNGSNLVNSTKVIGAGTQVVELSVSDDGKYKIIATAYDKAGNSNYDEKDNVIIDTIAPQTQINATTQTGPYDFNWTNDTVNIEFNVIDENPNVTYYEIDNNGWVIYSDRFEISENGNHTLKYYSIDMAGNKENTNVVYILVDKEKPKVSFEPYNSDWINQDLNVTINGSDSYSGIEGIYYLVVNPNEVCPTDLSSYNYKQSNVFNVTLDSTSKICAYVIDKAGNINNNESGVYYIDEVEPIIQILSPNNNSYLNHSNVEVKWTGSDSDSGIKEYFVKNDSGNWIDVGSDNNYTFNLVDGKHEIFVKAVDFAGNENTSNIIVYVDTIAPHINITSPVDGSITNSRSVTISWNADDNLGIDHFDVYMNGTFVNTTTSYSYEFDNLQDGKYVVEVIAYDKAGNSNSSNVTFYVDTTPPKITFISPIGWTNENPTIIFNVSDVEPTVRCIVKLNGSLIYNKTSTPGEIKIPLTNVEGGISNLNITCKDWFYKSNETTELKVDNNTPIIDVVSPVDGTRIPVGSFVIKVRANDTQSGIKYVKVTFGSNTYNLVYDGTYYTTTLTSNVAGSKAITIKAEDNVGHETSKGVTFSMYTPSTGGGGGAIGGGGACTTNGFNCTSNTDCCSGYCNAGICQAYPVNVSLNLVVEPNYLSIFDNQTAKFTIIVENKGTNPADGIALSLNGINGTLTTNSLSLGPGESKLVYLTTKEGIGKYIGTVMATWKDKEDSATFTLEVLDHTLPIQSKLAKSVCDNASAHILNLSSNGMNVSELYKEYHKAIGLMSVGNYSEAEKICKSILKVNYSAKKVPTRVTPFFIAVNGIKKNAIWISTIAVLLIAGIVAWLKKESIMLWLKARKFR